MASQGYGEFAGRWGERARLAMDVIQGRPARGIPAWMVHVMDVPLMERFTGRPPGRYARDPDGVYTDFQKLAGACYIDQYLADNPLTMEAHGFAPGAERTAVTGAERIVLDGMVIDSPEAVIEHLERFVFPARARRMAELDPGDPGLIDTLIEQECRMQRRLGPELLKGPFADGFQSFPVFHNYVYGYENYFMAYALYPEVMERDFAQQADLAVLENRAAAAAIRRGGLPPLIRLDYDMAYSRGLLVSMDSLERIWFPHFERAIRPFLDAGIRLIWHCDGNLMEMVPRLIEAGISGFQGFQYEDGMDYARICRMTDRRGEPLFIIAGVSVTRTLPHGTPREVRDELRWLVEHGPRAGLMLGASSSIVPGTPEANIRALIEGLHHYRQAGREA